MFEQLENYRPSHLEAYVVNLYRKHSVRSPQDIQLEMFAQDAGIWIHYMDKPSDSFEFLEGMFTVVIDQRMPPEQQRVELAHELGHVLLHAGRQDEMEGTWLQAKQEWQADRFAMFALVPTFMLINCMEPCGSQKQLTEHLASCFNVDYVFMEARLQILKRRMYEIAMEDQMAAAIAEASVGYDYSYRHPGNPRIELLVRNGNIIGQRRRADI